MRRLALFIATFGYVGYVPVAPGTFGSAAGLAVFYAVRATESSAVEVGVILVLFALGLWSACW
jgi:phosphatidylglycerophosphatase A